MQNNVVRIGIAGCGWIAQKAHIPIFNTINNVEVVSLFDISKEVAINVSDKFQIPCVFSDYEKFLDSGIDAVIVSTPTFTHSCYSIMALEKGKHVLCEKPIVTSLKEMEAILKIEHKSKIKFMPGFVNRFRQDIIEMHNLLRSGEIGLIERIEGTWLRRSGVPRPGSWFTCKKFSGGGVLMDLGSHILDICQMLSGKSVNSSYSVNLRTLQQRIYTQKTGASWFKGQEEDNLPIDVEDSALAKISFNDNLQVKVKVSWCAPIEKDMTTFKVYGTKGSVILETLFGFSTERMFEEDSITVYKKNSDPLRITFEEKYNSAMSAFENMANYFIEKITNDNDSYCNIQDGILNVKTLERLYDCEEKEGFSPAFLVEDI